MKKKRPGEEIDINSEDRDKNIELKDSQTQAIFKNLLQTMRMNGSEVGDEKEGKPRNTSRKWKRKESRQKHWIESLKWR